MKIVLTLIAVNILFGTGYPLTKQVLSYLDPATWLLIRLAASTLILAVVQLRHLSLNAHWFKELGWLILAAVLGILINQLAFVEGLAKTLPAHAAIINATIPLQTLFFEWFLLKERITVSKSLGVLLGLAGVLYLLGVEKPGVINLFVKGDLLIVLNAASYSLYLVVAKKWLSNFGAVTALFWMSLFGSIGIGFYQGWEIPFDRLISFPLLILGVMLYLVVFTNVIPYSLNLWALKRVDSSHAALYVYLQPVVAVVLSYFMMGDLPSERFYISGAMILAGLVVYRLNFR